MLEVRDLHVRIGKKEIVRGVSFRVEPGEWLMLAGPNGAGKSTVVNAIGGGIPYTGDVRLYGKDTRAMKPAERSRIMGTLAQNHFAGYDFTVREVAALGRYAWRKGMLSGGNGEDGEKVEAALEMTGLSALADRAVTTLSGGELQRTFLAQVFAQEPKLLILDEPTNHLDLKYQQQVFELIRAWLSQGDRAVLSVVHDLSLVRAYGTRMLLLTEGEVYAQGDPADVMTRDALRAVYGMDVDAYMRGLLEQWK